MMALPRCTSATAAKVPLMVIQSPYSLSSQPVVGGEPTAHTEAEPAARIRCSNSPPAAAATAEQPASGNALLCSQTSAAVAAAGQILCCFRGEQLPAAGRSSRHSPALTRLPLCISCCCCPKSASQRRTWTWRRSRLPRTPGRHAPAPPPCALTAL